MERPNANPADARNGSETLQCRLYSPGDIVLATLLGTPLAGCLLLAANFKVLGKADGQRNALFTGVITTVALLPLLFVIPENIPEIFIALAYTFVMKGVVAKTQEEAYKAHIAGGGAKHSGWRTAGVTTLCLALFVGVFAGALFVEIRRDQGAYYRAITLVEDGQIYEAESIFQEYQHEYPDDPATYWNLALIYASRADTARAIEQLEAVLAREPDNSEFKDFLNELTER